MSLKQFLTKIFPSKTPSKEPDGHYSGVPEALPVVEAPSPGPELASNEPMPVAPPAPVIVAPPARGHKVRTVNGKDIYSGIYTEGQKLFICECIARMMTPSEIGGAFEEEFKTPLNNPSVIVANYKRTAKWKSLIDKTRTKYLNEIHEIAGAHKKVRMERRERIYHKALKKDDLKHALIALKQEEEEMEGNKGNLNLTFNQYNVMTDEELEEKKRDILDRLKILDIKKGDSNGSSG